MTPATVQGWTRGGLAGLAVGADGTAAARPDYPAILVGPIAALHTIELVVRPRWVVWSQDATGALVEAIVRAATAWDVAAVHRLWSGGWRAEPARAWAAAHGLAIYGLPAVGPPARCWASRAVIAISASRSNVAGASARCVRLRWCEQPPGRYHPEHLVQHTARLGAWQVRERSPGPPPELRFRHGQLEAEDPSGGAPEHAFEFPLTPAALNHKRLQQGRDVEHGRLLALRWIAAGQIDVGLPDMNYLRLLVRCNALLPRDSAAMLLCYPRLVTGQQEMPCTTWRRYPLWRQPWPSTERNGVFTPSAPSSNLPSQGEPGDYCPERHQCEGGRAGSARIAPWLTADGRGEAEQ